jgi:hypothetical protein
MLSSARCRPVRRVDDLTTGETIRYLPTHPRIADLLPWDGFAG